MAIRVSGRAVIICGDDILLSEFITGSTARLPDTPDPNQTGAKWIPLDRLAEVELLPHIGERLRGYLRTGAECPAFLEEPVDPRRAEKYFKR